MTTSALTTTTGRTTTGKSPKTVSLALAMALAGGLSMAVALPPAPALAVSEAEMGVDAGRPRRGWERPPRWERDDWDRGGWRDDSWRRPPPPPVYRPQPPFYDVRPTPDAGPGCRIVYQRDNWGGVITLRDCRVCEPVVVTDQWGNRHRETRCRTVRQRIG